MTDNVQVTITGTAAVHFTRALCAALGVAYGVGLAAGVCGRQEAGQRVLC
jgi:hypothetical protein